MNAPATRGTKRFSTIPMFMSGSMASRSVAVTPVLRMSVWYVLPRTARFPASVRSHYEYRLKNRDIQVLCPNRLPLVSILRRPRSNRELALHRGRLSLEGPSQCRRSRRSGLRSGAHSRIWQEGSACLHQISVRIVADSLLRVTDEAQSRRS